MDGLWTYLCVCVSGVPAYVMSGRELTTGTPDTHTHRQNTATYQIDEVSRLRK